MEPEQGLEGYLIQESPTSGPWTGTSLGLLGTGPHSEGGWWASMQCTWIIPKPHPPPQSAEKLSSMKLDPGAKKVGDCWSNPTSLFNSSEAQRGEVTRPGKQIKLLLESKVWRTQAPTSRGIVFPAVFPHLPMLPFVFLFEEAISPFWWF